MGDFPLLINCLVIWRKDTTEFGRVIFLLFLLFLLLSVGGKNRGLEAERSCTCPCTAIYHGNLNKFIFF